MTVLKMRGSVHDKGIREFTIDQGGMISGGRSGTSPAFWPARRCMCRPATSSGCGRARNPTTTQRSAAAFDRDQRSVSALGTEADR